MKPVPSLFINKNPRGVPPGSIVCAKNMMLDDSGENLVNDNGISSIALPGVLGAIRLVIPVIGELIIVCNLHIYRYNEATNIITTCPRYTEFDFTNAVSLHGDYYYNVRNELTIAIAGVGSDNIKIPLVSINLDSALYTPNLSELEFRDIHSVSPIMPCGTVDHTLDEGNAKKGNYHIFIRYCFNDIDKTKWVYTNHVVHVYGGGEDITLMHVYDNNSRAFMQCSDKYSTTSNVSNLGFTLSISFDDVIKYYKTFDIAFVIDGYDGIVSYIMGNYKPTLSGADFSYYAKVPFSDTNLVPVDIDELTEPIFSVSNVGQAVSHQNRLYIADYIENDMNPANITDDMISQVAVRYMTSTSLLRSATKRNTRRQKASDGEYYDYSYNSDRIDWESTIKDKMTYTTLIPGDIYSFYIHFVRRNGTYTNGYKLNPRNLPEYTAYPMFEVHTNAINNDKFFKVPSIIHNSSGSTLTYNPIVYIGDADFPDEYVAFFLTMEIPEPRVVISGLVCNKEMGFCFDSGDESPNVSDREALSNTLELVTSQLYADNPIPRDNIKFEPLAKIHFKRNSVMRKDDFDRGDDKTSTSAIRGKYSHNMIPIEILDSEDYGSSVAIDSLDTMPAYYGDPPNIHRCIRIKVRQDCEHAFAYNDKVEADIGDKWTNHCIATYAQIVHSKADYYTNPKRRLIPMGRQMPLRNSTRYSLGTTGAPGYSTWDSAFVYNSRGIIVPPDGGGHVDDNYLIDPDAKRYSSDDDNPGSTSNLRNPCLLFSFPTYSYILLESRVFTGSLAKYSGILPDMMQGTANNYILSPDRANSIMQFRGKFDFYSPVYYTNVDDNARSQAMLKFTRTLRRSTIMQDESMVNAWKLWKANNYKVISENKGEITNLVSIGVYLIVHCEHSMFLFNGDNSLGSEGSGIQLMQPDIFDMGYREVFTSKMGYAGLQDKYFSNIVGKFGYIFYDASALTIYRFDDMKLTPISDDIVWLLHFVRPDSIIMTFDDEHDRIIMCMTKSGVAKLTISYSIVSNGFVSMHDYMFYNAVFTKEHTYILNGKFSSTIMAEVRKDTVSSDYGAFFMRDGIYPTYYSDTSGYPALMNAENMADANGVVMSYVDLVWNTLTGTNATEVAIVLDSVKYVTSKYDMSITPITPTDIGERGIYPGDFILAYSDNSDGYTDVVDVSTGTDGLNPMNPRSNWKKPMYDKGWFTLSHLRLNAPAGKSATSDNMRYVYGKYVVVRFIFKPTTQYVKYRLESIKFNVKEYGE